jgi:plastocyanin
MRLLSLAIAALGSICVVLVTAQPVQAQDPCDDWVGYRTYGSYRPRFSLFPRYSQPAYAGRYYQPSYAGRYYQPVYAGAPTEHASPMHPLERVNVPPRPQASIPYNGDSVARSDAVIRGDHRSDAPRPQPAPRAPAPGVIEGQPGTIERGYRPSTPRVRPTTVVNSDAYDNNFEPSGLEVLPGTTVRWTNKGSHNHTITSVDGFWDSGNIPPGASYSVTFFRPGTYYFYCRHHTEDNMRGVVDVRDYVGANGEAGRNGARGTTSSSEARRGDY